jgi:outer membrane protein
MKKLSTLISAAVLSLPMTSMADTLSVSIGGGMWKEDPGGYFRNAIDPTNVDVKDDLFWKEEDQGYLFVTLEHFVPIIPNFRLMTTSLDHSGSGTASFTLDGKDFTGDITSSGTFDQTDITAYWEVLDNVVSLDLGLNIKLLDFSFSVASTAPPQQTSGSLKTTIPMVYGMVGVAPIPGLHLGVEANWIGYDGNDLTDFTAKVSYTTDFYFGFEGGYRSQSYKLDDVDGYFGKLEFKGPFIGAYVKF